MGRPKAVLALDAELREQLENLAGSRSLPAGLVRRGKIILLCASGKTKLEVAGQLETSDVTVGLWRRRFLAHGLSGSMTSYGRVGPISDERVAQLIRKTLKSKPKAGTHWSIREIAAETGVSKSTVHRIWQAFGLQPHSSALIRYQARSLITYGHRSFLATTRVAKAAENGRIYSRAPVLPKTGRYPS